MECRNCVWVKITKDYYVNDLKDTSRYQCYYEPLKVKNLTTISIEGVYVKPDDKCHNFKGA